jgi:hypothetical protein
MATTTKSKATNDEAPPVMDLECPNCGGVEIEDSSPGTIIRRVIGHSGGEPIWVFQRYEVETADFSYRCVECGKRSKRLGAFVRDPSDEPRF